MKNLISGLAITAVGAALTVVLWVVLSVAFEAEQSALNRIAGAVNTAAWIPMIVYLITGLIQIVRFRGRVDQESYQPLKKPVSVMVVFIVQAVVIGLLGRPASDMGQASLAFVCGLLLTLLLGLLAMAAALIWGRPIIGRTKLPFARD